MNRPVIGQECVCPDGLGRVAEVIDNVTGLPGLETVRVNTYLNNRSCCWDRRNVQLVELNLEKK